MRGEAVPVDPFDHGIIDVGDGHQVYWEAVGNPDGVPAVYFHGGPGSGASPGQRRFFDPDLHLGVIFDQRGCGRSRPLASERDADLSTNTTHHLIADAELLREHLGIERWFVLGISWGATLAQAYAHVHRDRVQALVLALVTTTSRREVEWITNEVGRIFPQEWDRLVAGIPEHLRHLRIIDAYGEMLADPDPAVHEPAAREWCAWEDTHVSLAPGYQPNPRYEDPEFRLRFARLVTHYWRHHAFLEEDQLMRDAANLNGIPGVMIHGRYDVSGPLETPWRLRQTWTDSELQIMPDAGHGGADLPDLIRDALRRFAAT